MKRGGGARHAFDARPWVALLLAAHVALAVWGALRTSVTFDENFHLAAGVATVTRGDLWTSAVNPPLVKALCALSALAAGARVPEGAAWMSRDAFPAGWAFQHANADRFRRVVFAARLVTVALSVVLALLVLAFATRLYGAHAGVFALALYALAPEALAHAGVVTLDVATALSWMATVLAFWRFARTGAWRWWWALALAFSFALLTRFTALALVPVLIALGAVVTVGRAVPRPGRMWAGLALLLPVGIVALGAGYLGQVSFFPFGSVTFESGLFRSVAHAAPWLRMPLPDAWLRGFDHQTFDGQTGVTTTYVLGRALDHSVPWYFPFAMLIKWPLGLWIALVLALVAALAPARSSRRPAGIDELFVVIPAASFVLGAATLVHLNAGVRYMLPVLPFACVLAGRLLADAASRPGRWRGWVAAFCMVLTGYEAARAAPWYLSSFNPLAGDPRSHDRLLNDSNVDWGQGLVALREDMARLGIRRIHLAYHGTTDPALYGIDYVPYLGGLPGPESDWLAVSSYYWVGLAQRMVTPQGRTDFMRFDFRPMHSMEPVSRPAGCMYLFRIR